MNGYKVVQLGTVTPRKFDQLLDVNMTGVADGNLVSYAASTKTFVPYTGTGGIPPKISITDINVSGISTLSGVTINNGIVTSSNPGFSSVVYYGDGSKLTGIVGLSSYVPTAGFSSLSNVAYNIFGGQSGNLVFQLSPGITTFVSNGTIGQVLTFDGTVPVWQSVITPISGISIFDEGNLLGSLTGINFVGDNVSVSGVGSTATVTISQQAINYVPTSGIASYSTIAGYSTVSGIATFANTSGVSTNVIGGIGSLTSLTVSGIVTSNGGFVGNLTGTASSSNIAEFSFISGYSTSSGVSTFSNVSGYSTSSGISTYSNISGLATYSANSGVATYANVSGLSTFSDVAGFATTANRLQNTRTFQINGDIIASPQNFDGSQNVSFAATIQPNSVGLGTNTYGDYVKNIIGTLGEIEVSLTSGEGVSSQIGLPDNVSVTNNLTVGSDVQVNRNLNVNGNITIGGTTAYLIVDDFIIKDRDIVVGYTTNLAGFENSNDISANSGGLAVASTEGSPLVNLVIAGIETLPATYKKLMWFQQNSFVGLNTDAWLSNYAVGVGSTQIPNNVWFATGNVQITKDDIIKINNINASGIITASNFIGNLSGNASFATSSGIATYAVISGYSTNSGVSTVSGYAINAGIATYSTSSGIATNANSAAFATISGYSTSSGIATNANSSSFATIAGYSTSSGIATYASISGVSTDVSGGNGNLLFLNVTGVTTSVNIIGTAATITNLGVSSSLLLPLGPPTSPVARNIYPVANTVRYRDGLNTERILLNNIDNLSSLTDPAAALSNIGGLPLTFNSTTITYAATVDLDMLARNGTYPTISLTGNLVFTTSNRAAGRSVTIRLICDATQRSLTVPAGWVFVGTKPSNIAVSKTAILSLTFFGTADTDCVAAYSVQL